MTDLSFTAYMQKRLQESTFATTPDEKEGLRTIISKLIAGDKEWLKENHFYVGDKGDHWLVNYHITGKNELNRLTRGLVVRKPPAGWQGDLISLIQSFPFIRFFNAGEVEAPQINYKTTDMLEKLDGTMVAINFPHGDYTKPEYHTRKMSSRNERDMGLTIRGFGGKTFNLMQTIKPFVQQVRFSPKDVNYTYVFEFIHEASAVITKYQPQQYGLYLLGGRHLPDHVELSEDELDAVAPRLGVRRPRRFDAVADHSEITKMFDLALQDTPDFEGFIFRDRNTGKRVKVKDPRYVQKHHLIDSLSYKNLIALVLNGEEAEVLSYFPIAKEYIDNIKKAYTEYLDSTAKTVAEWGAKNLSQDELSRAVFGENPLSKWEIKLQKLRGEYEPQKRTKDTSFVNSMAVKYAKLKDFDQIKAAVDKELRKIGLGQGTNAGSPERLIKLLNLEDKEDAIADIGEL